METLLFKDYHEVLNFLEYAVGYNYRQHTFAYTVEGNTVYATTMKGDVKIALHNEFEGEIIVLGHKTYNFRLAKANRCYQKKIAGEDW